MTESTGELVLQVARALRRRWGPLMEPYDVSPHQARALAVVCRSESPPRLSEIAEQLRVAPRSATEVIDALEERGLVERCPDPADRRAVCVRVTPEGRRIRRAIDRARDVDADAFFQRLTDHDRASLERILRRLVEGPEE